MVHPILMPRPGQMTEECTLLAWRKDEGDRVEKGDVLFEIETDKAVMEVEAFDEGVLLRRLVAEGETVAVNAVCAYIGEPGEAVPESPVGLPAAVTAPEAALTSPSPAPMGGAAGAAPRHAERAAGSESDGRERRRARISPRASRLAAELGVDARGLVGSGPDGRIVERDIRGALAVAGRGTPPTDDDGEPQPLSRMRQIIAERMTLSAATAPQFSVTVAVDVTRLITLRDELKASGTPLSVTDFVMKATALTLVEMPVVNSRTDGRSLWLRARVHLGLAVSVPDGLVVIVLRDAHRLGLEELHQQAATMAAAARAGTLPPDDMTGSTFTISNLGMYGVEQFAAIINPGEAAILAVGSAAREPAVVGDGLTIRSLMRLTLTADHRLVDGELAARFLDGVRARLQDPAALQRAAADSGGRR
ncbi:MAG: dihydrolipoamide acetyltransferase family protein [Candidatus Limnocylindria bacterium]